MPDTAGCTGKAAFRSRELAAKVAARAGRSKRRRGAESWNPVPYRCRQCGQWHLGRKAR